MNLTANKFNESVLLQCTTTFARELLSPRANPHPQASLRVPVTPSNREYLRALRAAEADAWDAADNALSASVHPVI